MPRPGGSGITGAPSYTSLLEDTITDAVNNGITDIIQLTHLTSLVAAAGMGVAVNFQLEDSAGNTDQAGRLAIVWEDASSASEDSAFVVQLRIAGAAVAEVLRASPTAGLQMTVSDAATVTKSDVLRLDHFTSGAAGIGYGTGLLFRGEDAAGNTDEMARIAAVWTTPTSTLEDSTLSFMIRSGGAALLEYANLRNTGLLLVGSTLSISSGNCLVLDNTTYFELATVRSNAFMQLFGNVTAANTTLADVRLESLNTRSAGFLVHFANNGTIKASVDFAGLFTWIAGNEQTTVGAAGGASALPATPTKFLKIRDSAGTTLVVPAYAAV